MTELVKVFESSEFGDVRVILEDGKELFVANDIAKALGYSNPSKATNDHCKCSLMKWGNDSLGRKQEFKMIPESDVFRLIVKSNYHQQKDLRNGYLKKFYLLYVKMVDIFIPTKMIQMKR